MDDIRDTLRLIRSRRVGAVTFHRLLDEHGSARDALRALPAIARASGVEAYEICPTGVVEAELRQGEAAGAEAIGWGDPRYPLALAALPDAPPVLWAMGRVELLNRPALALVGARNASSLGVRMARTLAFGLADAGHVVVSGLARGIDTAAHASALEGGTVAVMAGGIDVIYPAENTGLATSIATRGCLLSEQPPGTEPQARHFPMRNRIVAGLSRGVVVVEAAARSGSLITAKMALDQGREVYAVPGHPFDARAAGCNQLIREGATLVTRVADVLEGAGTVPRPAARPVPVPPPRVAAPNTLLDLIGHAPVAEDQLIRDLGLPPAQVAAEILTLELDGRIERQSGGMLIRLPD